MDKPTILSEWDLPPIEKIYEAISAVVDGRVEIKEKIAFVTSSNKKKQYRIQWDDISYSSNDNASYWQGYVGYPIIAVLMVQEILPYPKQIAYYFKDIDWNKLNTKYKRNYAAVVDLILQNLTKSGVDVSIIRECVTDIYERLKHFPKDYKYRKSVVPPPT